MYTQIGYGTVTYLTDTTADVSYSYTAVQDTKGTPGKDGYSTYLYDGALSESVTSIDKSHIAAPTGRFVQAKDIIISTFESTFGAMAQVVAVNDTIAAVDFIGTLQGGGASDYNVLTNIPVINQDLSAAGFTPVANTYYRHTGATTASFTQGVIYLYDTAYHKLGESGGGTTLNRYITTLGSTTDDSLKFMRILKNAKSIISIGAQSLSTWFPLQFSGNSNIRYLRLNGIYTQSSNSRLFGFTLDTNSGTKDEITVYTITTSGVTLSSTENISSLRVEYSNDTEII